MQWANNGNSGFSIEEGSREQMVDQYNSLWFVTQFSPSVITRYRFPITHPLVCKFQILFEIEQAFFLHFGIEAKFFLNSTGL
jgi:hypothetical protein